MDSLDGEIMHLKLFGVFGPRGPPTRQRKTGGHDLYGYAEDLR